jgi:hypothetical protein
VTIYRLFFANSPAHDSGGRVDCVVGFWERSLLFDKKRRCIASTTTVVAAESVHGRHVCARGDGRRPFEPPAGVVVAIPARQTEPKIPYSTAMSVCVVWPGLITVHLLHHAWSVPYCPNPAQILWLQGKSRADFSPTGFLMLLYLLTYSQPNLAHLEPSCTARITI